MARTCRRQLLFNAAGNLYSPIIKHVFREASCVCPQNVSGSLIHIQLICDIFVSFVIPLLLNETDSHIFLSVEYVNFISKIEKCMYIEKFSTRHALFNLISLHTTALYMSITINYYTHALHAPDSGTIPF